MAGNEDFGACRVCLISTARTLLLALAATLLPACAAAAQPAPPLKTLAVLDLEVRGDTSDAARSDEWRQRLALTSGRLRRELAGRGVYAVVDNGPAADYIATLHAGQYLDACHGCERDIAGRLGAERVLVGHVYRVSQLILTLHVDIEDVASGRNVFHRALDFRGDNDEAWGRAVTYLVDSLAGHPGP